MCFSPTASFTAGVGLLIVGGITMRQARRPADMPFAAIPVFFAIQQLIEGALWLTFPDKAPSLSTFLTNAYSVFSHVLWPVYVPIAVLLLETVRWHRIVHSAIAVAGAAVGVYLLYFLATVPIVATVIGNHIDYKSPHFYIVIVMVLYVLGTCVSSLLSSHFWVRMFGVVSFLSFAAAGYFYKIWFISVWCFFAAVLSSIVLVYFLRRNESGLERRRAPIIAPSNRI